MWKVEHLIENGIPITVISKDNDNSLPIKPPEVFKPTVAPFVGSKKELGRARLNEIKDMLK